MNGMRLRHSQENFIKGCRNWIIGSRFSEEYGGIPDADPLYSLLAGIEMAKAGSGGVHISLMVHTIGAPPIQHFGSAELKARVLPGIISGEKISALAITEPGGGSDVAALQTKAVRDGDYYIVSGENIYYIGNSCRLLYSCSAY